MLSSTTHLYEGGIYWGDIIISGDLRDYDNPDEVMEWLEEACKNLPVGVGVRDGAMLAHSERGETLIVTHDGESWSDPR